MSIETLNFQYDLSKIATLQKIFDRALVFENNDKSAIRSYNPVLERWNFESLKTDGERRQFITHEKRQITTTLRERNHAAQSVVNFTTDETGNAYNELLPNEPFDIILQRGLEYRRQHGSNELERELREFEGWVKTHSLLVDPNTPLGTKVIVISGPGVVEEAAYKDNFVDIYEVIEDPITGKRIIKMTRHASQLSYGQYWNKALIIQPDYFEGIKGPIDAWFLGHPIVTDPKIDPRSTDEIFEQAFERRKDAIEENDFQQLLQACLPLILHYIEVLCSESFDPISVVVAFNAILKKNDLEKQQIEKIKAGSIYTVFRNTPEEVAWLGRQPIESFFAGCGLSGGFKIGGNSLGFVYESIVSYLTNSVGKFGLTEADQYGSLEFQCPKCNRRNMRPFNQLLSNCQHCGTDVRC